MKTGFTSSVVAHAAVLIVAIVGLGSAKPYAPPMLDSISVDLVPISDFTNIRAGSLKSKVVETETPAVVEDTKPATLAQPTGNTEENQIKPQETAKVTPAPVVNAAPEPVKEVQPEPEPDPVPEPVPEPDPVVAPEPAPTAPADPTPELAAPETPEPALDTAPRPVQRTAALDKLRADYKKQLEDEKKKQADEAKRKKAEEQKRTEQAKLEQDKQAKKADEVAALINSEKSRGATTGAGGTPTLGKNTGTSATLTQSQLDGLVAQIKGCMNIPPGSAEAGITAQLHFGIDGNGNVTQRPDIVSAVNSPLERALASAAQRAIMACGPYAMAVSQEVKATFDPRELL